MPGFFEFMENYVPVAGVDNSDFDDILGVWPDNKEIEPWFPSDVSKETFIKSFVSVEFDGLGVT